jgi:hypothetical protein
VNRRGVGLAAAGAVAAALAPLADLLAARGVAAGPLADDGLEGAADGPAGPPERQTGPWRG